MQRNSIWLAHKYWGKKPYFLSHYIISRFTKSNDIVLDPFCGSWSLVIDALFQNRKLIWIDINPTSIYFNKIITNWERYDNLLKIWLKDLKPKLLELEKDYYQFDWKLVKSFLRKKWDDKIIASLFKDGNIFLGEEIDCSFYTNKYWKIHNGFNKELIQNSRLSVKKDTLVKNYFTDLSIACHSEILEIIESYDVNIKNFFKVAFTANIANCSKLLPPIKSRGIFAPWAWMTWFYIADEYIENNVFHYYFNRVEKLLKAKAYFEEKNISSKFWSIEDVISWNSQYNFSLWNSQNLEIQDNSIDIIITDPPYEWVVPYLEQSMIWNAFWEDIIDLENEIVISDAKERKKDKKRFNIELWKSFSECNRVLKTWGQLVFTYNSVDIENLNHLSIELTNSWFEILEVINITQKTATPRQINRRNTVKGDLLIICKKNEHPKEFIFTEWFLLKIENINNINFNQ